MTNTTLVSYPQSHDDYLLSLTGLRSKYMVPFAGRHRIIDFTLRNAAYVEAGSAIIFSKTVDDLPYYVANHPLVKENKIAASVITSDNLTVTDFHDAIAATTSEHFILYSGDNPCFINFEKLYREYLSSGVPSLLFRIVMNGSSSMEHTVFFTNREFLLDAAHTAMVEDRRSPNIFQMLINRLINMGVQDGEFDAVYWPIRSVLDYYEYNMYVINDRSIFNMIYSDPLMKNAFECEKTTQIGRHGNVSGSYISEGCILNGIVRDSIIFPGVVVAEDAVVRNSILLPYVAVGRGAKITRSVIDEYTDYNQSDVLFNIGSRARIGDDEILNLKNNDYSRAIYNSITLIGKNAIIPDGVKIGAACYVASATSPSVFNSQRVLDDGCSIQPYAPGLE